MEKLKLKICLGTYCRHRMQYRQIHKNTSSAKPKAYSEIPQPKGIPFIGTIFDYLKKSFNPVYIHTFIQERHKRLGPIYKEKVLVGMTEPAVFTSSPEDLEAVFRNDAKFPRRPPLDVLGRGRDLAGLNQGIFNAQDEDWYRMRKVFNEHLLTNKSIWMYTQQHLDIAFDLVNYIKKNKNAGNELPDFGSVLYRWALECATAFTLDARLGAFNSSITKEAIAVINTTENLFSTWVKVVFKPQFWKYFKTKDARSLQTCQEEHFQALNKYIKLLFEKSNVSEFVKRVDESNLNPAEKEMVVSDILAAGVHTTSNAAAFVIYCLATNPEKQEILRSEIQEVLSFDENVSGKTLQQMAYLHAVLLESQRLYPLTTVMQRIIPNDMELSGYLIPANTMINLTANFINHKNPIYFEEPNSFIPERWSDNSFKRKQKFVMSGSFGMGARMCPGRRFALQELGCLLLALLNNFKIEYHYEPILSHFGFAMVPSEKPDFSFMPLDN